jgi:hypothetical protein
MHEEGMAAKSAKPKGDMPKQDAGAEKKTSEEPEEVSSEPIEDVVKEHGPAHHVEIHKDEATGKHHVHSKHGEEDHEHHSVHESAEEAMEHAGKAMGAEGEPEDEEIGEEAGAEMPAMEEHSRHIPGL